MAQLTEVFHIVPDLVILGEKSVLPIASTGILVGDLLGFGKPGDRSLSIPNTYNLNGLLWCVGPWSNHLKCSWYLATHGTPTLLHIYSDRRILSSEETLEAVKHASPFEPEVFAFSCELWSAIDRGHGSESIQQVVNSFGNSENAFVSVIRQGIIDLSHASGEISMLDNQILSSLPQTESILVRDMIAELTNLDLVLVDLQLLDRLQQFVDCGFLSLEGDSLLGGRIALTTKGMHAKSGSQFFCSMPKIFIGDVSLDSSSEEDSSPDKSEE